MAARQYKAVHNWHVFLVQVSYPLSVENDKYTPRMMPGRVFVWRQGSPINGELRPLHYLPENFAVTDVIASCASPFIRRT